EQQGRPDEHAEEDREELVDPAAAALELVEPVEIEDGRPQHDDHGDEDEVARESGHALAGGERLEHEVRVEAKEVGEDPGQNGGHRVHQDEYADHDPRLELHHVGEWANPSARTSSTKARKRASNTWRL